MEQKNMMVKEYILKWVALIKKTYPDLAIDGITNNIINAYSNNAASFDEIKNDLDTNFNKLVKQHIDNKAKAAVVQNTNIATNNVPLEQSNVVTPNVQSVPNNIPNLPNISSLNIPMERNDNLSQIEIPVNNNLGINEYSNLNTNNNDMELATSNAGFANVITIIIASVIGGIILLGIGLVLLVALS